MDTDPFEVLGLSHDASDSDIKKASRRLSREYHPDTNNAPDAAQRFDEVRKAAETLLNPEKREEYNRKVAATANSASAANEGDDSEAARSEAVVEPSRIDFGTLRPDGPSVEATLKVSWIGRPPLIVRTNPVSGGWWTRIDSRVPVDDDPRVVVTFVLSAQATSDMDPGPLSSHLDVIFDGHSTRVELIASMTGDRSTNPQPRTTAPYTTKKPSDSIVIDPVTKDALGFCLIIVAGVVAVLVVLFLIGRYFYIKGTQGPGSSVTSTRSATVSLPFGTDNLVMADGSVFSVKPSSASLIRSNNTVVWQSNAPSGIQINDAGNYAGFAPQASTNCGLLSSGSDISSNTTGMFISLKSGAMTTAPGYGVLSGDIAAWSDGTIRNACTGAVQVNGAFPSGFIPDCFTGSVVIHAATGWRAGNQLWQVPTYAGDSNTYCDSTGTTVLLDPDNETISRIDPATGNIFWHVNDPSTMGTETVTFSSKSDSMFEVPGVIFLSNGSVTIALDENTGNLLWQKRSTCVLATRLTPAAAVLTGPCTEGYASTVPVTAVDPRSGAAGSPIDVSSYGYFSASSTYLLLIDTTNNNASRVLKW
jgi:hypothetical protein